jgi:hypothetical protein
MILVRYEYICDRCDAEIRAPQSYKLGFDHVRPEPNPAGNVLFGEMLCGECAGKAQRALEDA